MMFYMRKIKCVKELKDFSLIKKTYRRDRNANCFLLGQSSRGSDQTSGTEGGFELASSNFGTCRGVALHSTLPDGSSGNPGLSIGLKHKLSQNA